MSKPFFKPGDFNDCGTHNDCVNEANRLLTVRGVRVVTKGLPVNDAVWASEKTLDKLTEGENDYTHQALLVCIEELPKRECEHEGYLSAASVNIINSTVVATLSEEYRCKHCGVKLKARWKEVK